MPREKGGPKLSAAEVKKGLERLPADELAQLALDLYSRDPRNRDFIHARLGLAGDPLTPYRRIIRHSLNPEPTANAHIQLAKARKAVSDFTKASGDPWGVLELMVYYVECGNACTVEYGDIDEPFYNAVEGMFAKAVKRVLELGPEAIEKYQYRLEDVVDSSDGIGWGYHDALEDMYHSAFPGETPKKGSAP